ncbi:pyruvate dehydrogenase E2 component (dihydrolipoamide acetyltransferase) [Actinomadura pelletieri DSM 43383]|uniref:Dihydrolipoamide acetyltransferase component of pyruvate dehydrogenase complex n=1 Tax=Actinomadura pelletieri DSM 43383 TaxID=1120940 RepID=A0A495QBE7_9ACTN|nr:dihydrolipoamide acetyltransferase family protein [Actinomadura pelletieri]RKS68824.1 pyruvate dehydrogenase E2 component (dihydrolipoamide acetyltransferase) [Actinomadura pelletieri DSM 43383]
MTEILMPRLSDTMEEGVISSWQKQPGDEVAVGDVIVDIETDKAVMEYEAYEAGVLEKILVAEGETAAIGAPIAVIAPAGGARPTADSAAPATAPEPEAKPEPEPVAETPASAPAPAPAARPSGGAASDRASRPPSSPLARRLARDHGIDLGTLNGSGPGGRIVRADIESAIRDGAAAPASSPAPSAAPSPAPAAAPVAARAADDPDVEAVPLNRFRKVAARRLTESKREAPHFYLNREVDAEPLLAFRATVNEALAPAKVSVNDLIVKAVATALREHPAVNVSYTEENLLFHRRVHVGIAVAVEDGLLVPVIKDADRKSVSEIGRETRELAGKARDGKLTLAEMSGGTFSVSNLGMFGVSSFSAVINPPEAAILAVGAVRDEPVVRDGQVVPGKRMTVTLSVDHRATDGATGARFLDRLATLLQNPLLIVA